MYPLPRMLIAAVLALAIAYAIVALVLLAPARLAFPLFVCALAVISAAVIAFFARGEPSDQAPVHSPRARKLSNEEFAALEDRVDRLAREPHSTASADERAFMQLVRQAIDELPPQTAHALDHVAVVVSDQGAVQRINGRRQPLYGLYVGRQSRSGYVIGAPVRNAEPDRIVIFRDTLVHDYGSDPERLRQEVSRTLRHELAHHLGRDEPGVRALGL